MLAIVSPGKSRKFRTALASEGNIFSLTPPLSMVVANVVRTIAFVTGLKLNLFCKIKDKFKGLINKRLKDIDYQISGSSWTLKIPGKKKTKKRGR